MKTSSISAITGVAFFCLFVLVSFLSSNNNKNNNNNNASAKTEEAVWPLFENVRVLASSVNGVTPLAAPVFSPNGGTFADDSTTVTVTGAPSNVTICVTTDGKSQPKCSATKDTCVAGTKYTTPLKKTASSNGLTWFAVSCLAQNNDSAIAATLPWCTPFTKTNYTDVTMDTEIKKYLTKKTDDVSAYTATQRSAFFAQIKDTIVMAAPKRAEIIAKSAPYSGAAPLSLGRKDAQPALQLLDVGAGVSTSIVAISSLADAVAELNVSTFASASNVVTDVVKVERFDANNQNLNNVAFTFRMYAPGVSKLQVLCAVRGETVAKDVVSEGGSVVDDSANYGKGWWRVSAKHTSSFVGIKVDDSIGLEAWAVALIIIGAIILAVLLISVIYCLCRGEKPKPVEDKLEDQYKAML